MKNNKIKLILFLISFFTFAYFTRIGNVNAYSRLALVYSLVNDKTFAIDKYHKIAGAEKSFFNGHYYTDKAIGLPLFSVPIYFALKQVSKINYFKNWLPEKIPYLIKVFSVCLTSALLVVFIFSFLELINISLRQRLIITFAFIYATPILQWSTLYYAHQFASFLFFLSFYILFKQKLSNNFIFSKIFLSGFFSGFAFLSDYPVAIFILPLIIYLYFILKDKKQIFFFITGIIPAVIIFLYYHNACFGSPFTLATSYHVDFETEAIRSMLPSTIWREISLLNIPLVKNIFEITLGKYRGLFFYSPVLIMFILGGYYFYKNLGLRKEFNLFLSIITLYFYFIFTRGIWAGGSASTPRYFVVLIPYLIILISLIPKKFYYIFYILLVYSVLINLIINLTLPEVPPHIKDILYFNLQALINFKVDKNLGIDLGLNSQASIFFYMVIIFLSWLFLFIYSKRKTINY